MTKSGQKQGRVGASIFQTRPFEKVSRINMLWRVGTGRDGFYDVPLYTRAHETKLLTRHYPSLLSLARANAQPTTAT